MASHSNRSPSPLPSRPSNLNPNPRNLESNPTARKSFNGNNTFVKPAVLTNLRTFDPITPANSPSDFARRRSVGKEGMASSLNNCEEKENDEKDQNSKATKLRSPAKGSKNFMSPTISAASKFTPSPRKKVLAERNDPVRTSISLSDGKATFFSALSSDVFEYSESKFKLGFDQNQSIDSCLDLNVVDPVKNEAVLEGPTVSKPLKKVTFLDVPSDSVNASESLSESVITDSDVESSLKNKGSCSHVSPAISALDADPSMPPPYDPKTNYLSPRPQFLYYKPNPRFELLLNKNGLDPEEFVRLEDSFTAETMSENVSDSEGTEESQSEDLPKEESELTASADMVVGIDDMEEASLAFEPSESLPVSSTFLDEISEENLVQKVEKKPRGFSRFMCGSLFLVFLVACVSLSVTHSPLVDELVQKDLSFSDLSNFYHQSRVASFAKENSDWLVRHVNQFQVDSISFISNLINKLGEREKLAPLQFMNLTDLQNNIWNKERFQINQELVDNPEENELEEYDYTEMELHEEEEYEEIDSDERFGRELDGEDDRLETEEMSSDPAILSVLEPKIQENVQGQIGIADGTKNKLQAAANSEDDQLGAAASQDQESNFEAKNVEMATDITDSENFLGDTNLGSSASADTTSLSHESSLDIDSSSEVVESSAMLESPARPSEDKFPSYYSIGISSIFVALLTVAAFIYQSKRISSSSNVVVQTDPFLSKKTGSEFAGTDCIFQEKRFSHTEVDVIGESCPSEMSSFQRSASYSNKELKGTSEVQSVEKKPKKKYSKRESLASSSSEYSMGSHSYGSFTTFERIPIKNNANGDDEVITPVRRSSRIRNQVTSP